jgi:tRNA(Arg) A34 adenosine deaminase TadA
MDTEGMRNCGVEHLDKINSEEGNIAEWKFWLNGYEFNEKYPEDPSAWLTCILALKGVSSGNFGIGCILVDDDYNVIGEGHNQVHKPYFRSDLHAEMVVMNQFEDEYKNLTNLKNYTLFTSLESCPMCMARLISFGVKTVLHVSPDDRGGMVHKMRDLPEVWPEIDRRQIFDQAKCSKNLIDAALQIFVLNAEELDNQLIARRL